MIDLSLVAGFVIGFLIAGAIGRVKFLKVQKALSAARTRFMDLYTSLMIERGLNEGLTQELDAVATKSRIRKA